MRMTVEELQELSDQVSGALRSKNWNALKNVMTPDLAPEFEESFMWLYSAFPDYSPAEDEVRIFDVEAQASAARLLWRGTHQGEIYGVAPTGTVIEFRGLVMERYQDGKGGRVNRGAERVGPFTAVGSNTDSSSRVTPWVERRSALVPQPASYSRKRHSVTPPSAAA